MIINNGMVREVDENKIIDINKYYKNNQTSLEKIDKVLSSIINQSTDNTEYILLDKDVVELLELTLKNKANVSEINVNIKTALKSAGFIRGSINDSIFLVSEIVNELIKLHSKNTSIDIILTDDEKYWYFKILSSEIEKLPHSQAYLFERVAKAMSGNEMSYEEDTIIISIAK